MFTRGRVGWIAVGGLGCLLALAAADDPAIPFPAGYRHWVHLHSTIVTPKAPALAKQPCEKPCNGGIYHFYANDLALEGLRTGKYSDGAVFADELLETKENPGGSSSEGPRRGVGVMVRNSLRYRDTGGWGFASYEGNTQTESSTPAERKTCFACHVPRKDQGYVFTEYHE